jgi:hypothetical protein
MVIVILCMMLRINHKVDYLDYFTDLILLINDIFVHYLHNFMLFCFIFVYLLFIYVILWVVYFVVYLFI